MHIALFHNQPPGGARRALVELGRRLSSRHKVDVYMFGPWPNQENPYREFADRVQVYDLCLRSQTRMGMHYNDFRKWQDLRDLHRLSHLTAQAIDQGEYDVVLVDVDRWIGGPFVLRYLDTPHAYYCHEPPRRYLEPMCRPRALPLSRWERARLIWRWPTQRLLDASTQQAERRNVQAAEHILTNSDYNRRRIAEVYGRDAQVCYLGVDTNFFSPDNTGPMPEDPEVLTVGALEPHKGFEFLIRAVAQCQSRPRLRIVGGGGHHRMAGHLQELASRVGVRLSIDAGLNDEGLRARYRQASLFLFAPHSEPFGLVALEAMACGKPVIAVAEGGLPEIVVPDVTGLLLSRSEQRWAKAVDGLLSDPERRKRMGAAGRKAVLAHWKWDRSAEHVEQILTDIAKTPGRET